MRNRGSLIKSFRCVTSLLLALSICLGAGGCRKGEIKMVEQITPTFTLGKNFKLKKAEVREANGVPALHINGKTLPMVMFTQWVSPPSGEEFMEYPNYLMQAKYAGITIYQPRNSGGGKDWETVMAEIVEQDENALFILPMWVQSGFTLPNQHEHMDTTSPEVFSVGSLEWLEGAKKYAAQLTEAYLSSAYKERIIGFMPTAGNTGEWFDMSTYQLPGSFDQCEANQRHFRLWLRERYQTDEALATAWNKSVTLDTAAVPVMTEDGPFLDPAKYRDVMDYMEYHSECYATAIEEIGLAVKEACDNTRVVMVAYGYLMALANHNNTGGSASFDQLLRGKGVDIFCSPLAYTSREYDEAATWHGFADSCRLHGKLWFSEDDTPTYLNTSRAYDWYKTSTDFENSNSFLWKNFASAVTKGYGFWWYDNYGTGMMNSPKALYNMGLMNSTVNATYRIDWESRTDIAIVLDEGSVFTQTPGAQQPESGRYSFNNDLASFRKYLSLVGAPFDIISLQDVIEGNADNYKLYIFANAFSLDATQRNGIDALKKDGKGLLFIRVPGILDKETGLPTQSGVQSLTGLDLRLAETDDVSQKQFGTIYVDCVGNLTEKSFDTLFSGFTTVSRPHMFAEGVADANVLLRSTNEKAIAVMLDMGDWTVAWADDISLLTPELLRVICDEVDVTLYNRDNTVVSADNRFVSVTVDDQSEITVYFPDEEVVYEVGTDTEYEVVDGKITLTQDKQITYFFYRGARSELSMERPIMLDETPCELVVNNGYDTWYTAFGAKLQIPSELLTKDNLNVIYDHPRTWTVENPDLLDIDEYGNVIPYETGTTKVTLEVAGFSKTIEVTIYE